MGWENLSKSSAVAHIHCALSASALVVSTAVWATPPLPQATGCGSQAQAMLDRSAPVTNGPFRLDTVHCLSLPNSSTGNSPPAVSPDGKIYFAYDAGRGFWYGVINAAEPPRYLAGRFSVPGIGYAHTIPFGWAADSQSIFGARQDTVVPNGWALGPKSAIAIPVEGAGHPLEAIRYVGGTAIPLAGMAHPLPALQHPAGDLDGLFWVGGNGLALAEFGVRGDYYRPVRPNPNPTLAIVDGLGGKVLQAIPMPTPDDLRPGNKIRALDARIDPNGKAHVLFAITGRHWFEWRQGSELRSVPIDLGNSHTPPFAITPDLTSVLIVHGLSATGMICEIWHKGSCTPPEPVSGVIADLREINTGRVLWRLNGTAISFSGAQKPAISPDGQYALINLPADDTGRYLTIAVISMRDGRILQKLHRDFLVGGASGFSEDGKTAWISRLSIIITYRLAE